MAIERRQFLGLVLLQPTRLLASTPAHPSGRLWAAWSDAQGRHFAGQLQADAQGLSVLWSLPLPTRAHGMVQEPTGSVLIVARRPGEWLLRLGPGSPRDRQWQWSDADRRFNGHALVGSDTRWRYLVEADLDSGQTLLVRREATSLEVDAEWPCGGVDGHQALADGPEHLLLALGGVPSQAETGRARRGMARMDSSLLRLDLRTGRPAGRWRLADTRLSLRHLARHPHGTVGVALQAEHDDDAQRQGAPLLACFDGQTLRVAEQPRSLAGYAGDIAADAAGFVLSAPRAGGLARWSHQGQWRGWQPLEDACALSAGWAAGRVGAQTATGELVPWRSPGHRLDNHWLSAGF